jgi:hypothetical protein
MFTLGRAGEPAAPLARVSAIRTGRCPEAGFCGAIEAGAKVDVETEARWIHETLERDGIWPRDVDLLLTGANGWAPLDRIYRGVAEALSRLAGRAVACGGYKHGCGEYHSASAFGFFTAIGLVRGEIAPEHCAFAAADTAATVKPCRTVVLYTLSPTGTKGMCCVRA